MSEDGICSGADGRGNWEKDPNVGLLQKEGEKQHEIGAFWEGRRKVHKRMEGIGQSRKRKYLAKKGVSRFSEDIDLDFISDKGLNEKISTIKDRVKEITGFDIEGPRILHRTLRFDCYYVNEFEQRDRVNLEFYLTQTEAIKTEEVLVKSPFIETHPTIFTVYSFEDLMARKFIALYNRMEGKDIYDLFYCLDLEFDRKNLVKALKFVLDFYKVNQASFLNALLLRLKEARKNAYYIGNSTNHFIPRNLRPEWKVFIDTLSLKIESALGDTE